MHFLQAEAKSAPATTDSTFRVKRPFNFFYSIIVFTRVSVSVSVSVSVFLCLCGRTVARCAERAASNSSSWRRAVNFYLMRRGEEVEGTGVATWGHNPDDWAAERPLILALFKHNAFEQQQHDAWQRAVVLVRDAASKGRRQLRQAASNTRIHSLWT